MKFKVLITSVAVLGLVTMFQNCGAVQFSPKSAESSNSKLTALDDSGDQLIDEDRVPTEEPTDGINDEDDDVVVNNEDEDEDEVVVNDDDEVVCVLDGPGNSIKLGIIESALDGANSAIASAVCISRSACLTKVTAKFTVKGIFPGSKGVCGHNPNLTHLSDAALALLL